MMSSRKIHPQQFALYLAMGSICMMFIALTSAYLVRRAAGNWLEFNLPDEFFYSTLAIALSSASIYAAQRAFRKALPRQHTLYLIGTLVLGLVFIALQYKGWLQMFNWGIELTGNPSGSFVYVLSGLHAAHVLGGIAALALAIVHAIFLSFNNSEFRQRRLRLTAIYWHFVGVLWVYLLLFLLLQR